MILKDKIIIITGGSGLIGKEIVNDIRRKGGIALNADINVKTDIAAGNLYVDITDEKSIEEGVSLVYNTFNRIDGLVNNAYPRTKDWGAFFEDIKLDSWRQNVDMQMNSYFCFCQKVLKYMSIQQQGAIVNIGSIYGVVGKIFLYMKDMEELLQQHIRL